MHHDSDLLIIGGGGRNVGKTEFACRLIGKIGVERTVYGLKVSTVYPDEAIFHGSHSLDTDHILVEEKRRDTPKDTSRMLRAGAAGVFYLRGEDDSLLPAYLTLREKLPRHAPVICESNSLVSFIRPALFVMVCARSKPVKARVRTLLEQADMVVYSDGVSGFTGLAEIGYSAEKRWHRAGGASAGKG